MAKDVYLGGHPTAGFSGEGTLEIDIYYRENLSFKQSLFRNFEIPLSSMVMASAMSEMQAKKSVTLTRLLAFGVFAFSDSLKKNTKEMTNILNVDCTIDDAPCSLVFISKKAHAHAAKINEWVAKNQPSPT